MKQYIISLLLISSLTVSAQERQEVRLDFDWQFSRDSLFSNPQQIDIPHDFQIEQPWVPPTADEKADNSDAAANVKSRLSARGFKEMGIGWYRKTIKPDLAWKGKRVLLDFEGIMLVGDVYLNGKHIGGTDYGYLGFEMDVTSRLKYGQENILVVKANTMTEKNSRWYTGGGLFRPVRIIVTARDLFFNRHPLHITTRNNQFVNISAEVTNRVRKNLGVKVCIYQPDGKLVVEQQTTQKRFSHSQSYDITLPEIKIEKPQLWNTDTPYLYKAVVQLLREDGSVADVTEEQFGIRTVEIGPDYGLKVNGKKVLLKGYANHHTLGALGAAAYPRAIEKRIQLMKQFGINHIRTSHNPYSREFIQLCDKYGILVVDELYDKWTQQHAGGRKPWIDQWQQNVREWVKRDRNSPSVVMWSLGNELQQIYNEEFHDFGVTAYELQKALLLRYDSTRRTTVAMHPRYRNWQTDSLPCDLAMKTDVQSYNYRYMYFPGDGKRFPWMTFYQSEANTSGMGPNYYEMNLDRVIGLAYWGAIDYLGESQGWPAKGWAQGVFDISLQPKPKAYLMKSIFTDEPMVRIAVEEKQQADVMWNGVQTGNQDLSENWTRAKDSKVTIYTYTNAEEVELLVNGKSVGKQKNPKNPKQRNRIVWKNVSYEDGKVEAIARNAGKVVAKHQLETTGPVAQIIAEPDQEHWKADGIDLQHVLIKAVDAKGRLVSTADDEVSFKVEGPARIVGISNGDICSNELTSDATHRLWKGSTLVILRAGKEAGIVKLSINSRDKTKIVQLNLGK